MIAKLQGLTAASELRRMHAAWLERAATGRLIIFIKAPWFVRAIDVEYIAGRHACSGGDGSQPAHDLLDRASDWRGFLSANKRSPLGLPSLPRN